MKDTLIEFTIAKSKSVQLITEIVAKGEPLSAEISEGGEA